MNPSASLLGNHKDDSITGLPVEELIEKTDGFAGVFPEHKYEIMKKLHMVAWLERQVMMPNWSMMPRLERRHISELLFLMLLTLQEVLLTLRSLILGLVLSLE